jgi:hypothetical protein
MRTYMGVERSTLLIDGKGRSARSWRKVKVPGHAEDVLAATKALVRKLDGPQPRPSNGIFVALICIKSTLVSSGRLAM